VILETPRPRIEPLGPRHAGPYRALGAFVGRGGIWLVSIDGRDTGRDRKGRTQGRYRQPRG
jgi:hypothetical protein